MRLTIMQSSHSISTLFSLKIWQIHLLEYIYQSITRISVAFHFMTFLSIYTFSAEWNTWESCGFLSSKFCVSAAVSLIKLTMRWFSSVQFSSVAQPCPTLWDPMDCSSPGLPVHHQLLKFTQTHAHWVGDVIQPSHHLSSPSPAFNLSQHQGLFKHINSSHQVAKILEF